MYDELEAVNLGQKRALLNLLDRLAPSYGDDWSSP
jgi:hypothetical protein